MHNRYLTKFILAISIVVIVIGVGIYIGHNYMISYIKTPSMEPVYNVGDLVIIQYTSPKQIHIGDVIVFKDPNDPSILILHRVVAIKTENNELYFLTKGDNNPVIDPWKVPEKNVVGKLVGRVPYIGYIFLAFDSWAAKFLLILIVIFVAVIYISSGEEASISLAPLIKLIREQRIKSSLLVLLSLFLVIVIMNSISNRGHVDVQILRGNMVESEDILYLYLNVTSRISLEVSINKISLRVISSSNACLGLGIWTISYPFYGNKKFSIAVLLNNTAARFKLYIVISVHNYLTGDSYNLTRQTILAITQGYLI